MATIVKIPQSEVVRGTGTVVSADNKQIALFHVDGAFYAIDNTCAHRGGPLGEGSLEGAVVTCPWHGWEYDVTSGACQTVETVQVTTYPVRVEGDQLVVEVPERASDQ